MLILYSVQSICKYSDMTSRLVTLIYFDETINNIIRSYILNCSFVFLKLSMYKLIVCIIQIK